MANFKSDPNYKDTHLFPSMKRKFGEEQRYIPLGMFKLRLPFVHVRLMPSILVIGFFVVALNVTSVVWMEQTTPGLTYDEYIAMMLTFDMMIALMVMLGNPTYSGYITPGIPLVIAYVTSYASTDDRIFAITAVACELTLMYLILGLTGLAGKMMKKIPDWFKAGILYGACFSALISVFSKTGSLSGKFICGGADCAAVVFCTYSLRINKAKEKSKVLAMICTQAIIVGFIVACVLAIFTGEIQFEKIEWGLNSLIPLGSAMKKASIWCHGVPPAAFWAAAFPTAFVEYVIAFGDYVLADSLFAECNAVRDDEFIEYDANRNNVQHGIRNAFMALTVPSPTMGGPVWAGGCISMVEQYKQGRHRMDSIYDGMLSLILGPTICNFLKPVSSFFKPLGSLGSSLLYAVQGFSMGSVANSYVVGKIETGIAIAMGIAMNMQSNLVGLVVGVIAWLILGAEEDQRRKEAAALVGTSAQSENALNENND